MTKMLRRSDVFKVPTKHIAKQWDIMQQADAEGDRRKAIHTRSRIDALRIVRDELAAMQSFVALEYAHSDAIPRNVEWEERIRLAGEMTDAPNEADVAMRRLLCDLHKPISQLQAEEDEMNREKAA